MINLKKIIHSPNKSFKLTFHHFDDIAKESYVSKFDVEVSKNEIIKFPMIFSVGLDPEVSWDEKSSTFCLPIIIAPRTSDQINGFLVFRLENKEFAIINIENIWCYHVIFIGDDSIVLEKKNDLSKFCRKEKQTLTYSTSAINWKPLESLLDRQ